LSLDNFTIMQIVLFKCFVINHLGQIPWWLYSCTLLTKIFLYFITNSTTHKTDIYSLNKIKILIKINQF
jgi:hypothetical protein